MGSLDTIVALGSTDIDYVNFLRPILASFCRQLDSSRPPLTGLSNNAKPNSRFQSEVKTVSDGLTSVGLALDVGDESRQADALPSSALRSGFALWRCNGGGSTCDSLCLASASLAAAAYAHAPMDALFFPRDRHLNASLLASEMHLVEWRDPINGRRVAAHSDAEFAFAVRLPLLNRSISAVLQCYLYPLSGAWRRCGEGERSQDGAQFRCSCPNPGVPGIVGAFMEAGPPLPSFPLHWAVEVEVDLAGWSGTMASAKSDLQPAALVGELAAAANLPRWRLADESELTGNPLALRLKFSVRPGYESETEPDVNEAVRALNRTMAVGLWLNNQQLKVMPHSLNATPIRKRNPLSLPPYCSLEWGSVWRSGPGQEGSGGEVHAAGQWSGREGEGGRRGEVA